VGRGQTRNAVDASHRKGDPVTYAEYAAIPGANFSTLKALALSPLHYRHRLAHPLVGGDTLRKGRAVHCAVFEPERFGREWPTWDGTRRGKEWAAFLASSGGDYLLEVEADWVGSVSAAVRADRNAAPLIEGGRPEHVVTWSDAETGIRCKGRLDYLRGDVLIDLKTCRDASPFGFGRAAARLLYHAQLAFYLDGVTATTGALPVPHLIAVESEAPHVVQVYRVADDELEIGRDEYRTLLRRLAECREADTWPGYGDGVMDLVLPSWVYGDDEVLDGLGLEFGDKEEASNGF
jgi:hypothetical protein